MICDRFKDFRLLILFIVFLIASSVTLKAQEIIYFSKDKFNIHLYDEAGLDNKIYIKFLGTSCRQKKIFSLSSPPRLVIDSLGKLITKNQILDTKGLDLIKQVRIGKYPNKTRFVIELKKGTSFSYVKNSLQKTCQIILSLKTEDEDTRTYKEPAKFGQVEEEIEEIEPSFEISTNVNFSNRTSLDFSNNNTSQSTATNHLLVKPEFELEVGENSAFVAGARIDSYYENVPDNSISELNVYLDQAYFNKLGDNYNFRIGNQIIRWGKTDEISPLDNVSPEDLQDSIVRRRDDRKIPVPAFNLTYYTQNLEIQGIFIPWFEESILPEQSSDWAIYGPFERGFNVNRENPNKNIDDAEYGFQIGGTYGTLDYAFNFLSTTNDLPTLRPASAVVPRNAETMPTFDLTYHRREIVGTSFEYAGELIGFRGDLAYSNAKYYLTESVTPIKSNATELVVGADYIGEESLYVNLQLGAEYIHQYDNSIFGLDRLSYSLFGEISNEFWESYIKLGARYFYNFSTQDSFANPFFEFNYWDWISLEVGANIINGVNGNLSFYEDNDQLYFLFTGSL